MNDLERRGRYHAEAKLLRKTFMRMTHVGMHSEDMRMEENMADLEHIPPGFRAILDHMINEANQEIHDMIARLEHMEDPPRPAEVLMTGYVAYLKMFAMRFYQLGNELAEKLPWQGLTPCGCLSITDADDAEFEALLSKPFEG